MFIEEWRELKEAPKNEMVLVVLGNCDIVRAKYTEYTNYDFKGGTKTKWGWIDSENPYGRTIGGETVTIEPKYWQPLPNPPKHLWERKLAAEILEKQVAELRK